MRKRNRGQSLDIHANDWNRVCDLAGQKLGQKPGGGAKLGPGEVWVKNSLGRDLGRYAAVCLCDTTPNELADGKNDQVYQIVNGSLLGRGTAYLSGEPIVGVLQEPIANTRIGRAKIAGVTPASFRFDENGRTVTLDYADISDLDDKLTFCNFGPIRVLSRAQAVNVGNSSKFYMVELGTVSGLGSAIWATSDITWNSSPTHNYGNVWTSSRNGDAVRVGLYQVGTTSELRLGRPGRYIIILDWSIFTSGVSSGERVDCMARFTPFSTPSGMPLVPLGGSENTFQTVPASFTGTSDFGQVMCDQRVLQMYLTGGPIATTIPVPGIQVTKTTSAGVTTSLTVTGRLRVHVIRLGAGHYDSVWTEAMRNTAWGRGSGAGPV